MTTNPEWMPVSDVPLALSVLRRRWLWFIFLGLALVIGGLIGLACPLFAALASAVGIGTILVVSGVAEIVGALRSRGWSGLFIQVLCGAASALVGLLFLLAPVDVVLGLTLLLGCSMVLIGVFKIVGALNYRFTGWQWPLLSGIVDSITGTLVCAAWPASAFWALGLFVGISLLFRGLGWAGFGLALRALPPAGGAAAV